MPSPAQINSKEHEAQYYVPSEEEIAKLGPRSYGPTPPMPKEATRDTRPTVTDGSPYYFAHRVYIRSHEIERRINQLADEIALQYKDKVSNSKPLVLIVILNGAFVFAGNLFRALSLRGVACRYDFVRVRSYKGTESTGTAHLHADLKRPVEGQHCLIVEDVVDSGRTLCFVKENIKSRNPLSLKVVCFCDKPDGRKMAFKPDFVGFHVPNEYIVGYGFELHDSFAGTPDVVALKPEMYQSKLRQAKL